MGRQFLTGLLVTALLVGAASFLAYPPTATAQQPQDPQMFKMRMGSRIDSIQMRIKALEKEITGGEPRDRSTSEFDTGGGLLGQLDEIDKQCRDLERELDSMSTRSMGFPSQVYEQQRQIEYYILNLDRQVQQVRRWMHPEEDKAESSVEPKPEIDTNEDGISDEDWAAEWAKGDP